MRHQLSTFLPAFLFLLSITASAQTKHQFTILSENDSYLSVNNDGYYTNGISMAYQWRSTITGKRNPERVNSISAGQNIYTSRFSGELKAERLDRPIAGYLYGSYHQSLFNPKERLIKWGVTAGVIGPSSLGEDMQKLAHRVMQIYKPTYWERQLPNSFGVNVDFTWSPRLGQPEKSSKWDFKPLLSATAGSIFTNAGVGGALVFGKFNKNSASAFWNNHQGQTKSEREFFAYLFPVVYLKAYDATVQGSMFNNEPSRIPGKLNPVFLQSKLGITYATNKLSFGAAAVYENKQSLTQRSPQLYGSLQVSLMW
ncbi:lipid A deacylase LpxR family protein [Niabella sp. W65]|nr:lipid A deacylase LpxR family protein [Niabella sp. W65]MCH7368645.1 lipid A deacylase LpxR family protein [Niabella sp. W65]ULT44224.1 lipid A deacylase LpxR family protein [Niabella sp. I65]